MLVRNTIWTLARLSGVWLASVAALAQPRADVLPPELDVGITEMLNAALPLDAAFVDETGRRVTLRDYFAKGRPVILTLNYYRCPMLCGLQLNGFLDALRELAWTPGGEFEIVTVSFDPLEEPPLARAKKQNYLNELGRPSAGQGWHFLTGQRDAIKSLTEAVGFRYKWNEARNEWAHAAALIICTPDGRVSRYLGGIAYEPRTLRLSLVEASRGQIGSLWDQLFLTCYRYDPNSRSYVMAAVNLMRLGGIGIIGLVALLLLSLWRADLRRRRAGSPPAGPFSPPQGVAG